MYVQLEIVLKLKLVQEKKDFRTKVKLYNKSTKNIRSGNNAESMYLVSN